TPRDEFLLSKGNRSQEKTTTKSSCPHRNAISSLRFFIIIISSLSRTLLSPCSAIPYDPSRSLSNSSSRGCDVRSRRDDASALSSRNASPASDRRSNNSSTSTRWLLLLSSCYDVPSS